MVQRSYWISAQRSDWLNLLPICKPTKAKQEQQRQQRIAEEEEKKKKEAEQAAKKKEEEQEKQKGNINVTKMLPEIVGHFGSIILGGPEKGRFLRFLKLFVCRALR